MKIKGGKRVDGKGESYSRKEDAGERKRRRQGKRIDVKGGKGREREGRTERKGKTADSLERERREERGR